MNDVPHDDEFVKELFNKMGPTYTAMNLISSFGFSEAWRRTCVNRARIGNGAIVCDMMAGTGECWRYIPRAVSEIISIDFSSSMADRQIQRKGRETRPIKVLRENAVSTSLNDSSVDHVVSAFGLKTLSVDALEKFAQEISRILKPGGTFSILEISIPKAGLLRIPYTWYISSVIPLIGRVLLGDVECYRMLGEYTKEFVSCEGAVTKFEEAGMAVSVQKHFFGCATSLEGTKNA